MHAMWFRLGQRLVGLLLVGISVPNVVTSAVGLLASTLSGPSPWYIAALAAGHGAQLALGLYLLMGGRWIADRIWPPRRCPACGHESLPSAGVCSECGALLRRLRE